MTNKLEFEFLVNKQKDVPKVGTRKRVKVNGKPETMYVYSVDVQATKSYDENLHVEWEFGGLVVYKKDLWL